MTYDRGTMGPVEQPCPQPSTSIYVGAERLAAKPRVWREGDTYVLELITAQDICAGFAQVAALDEKTEDGRTLRRVTVRLPEPPTNVTLTKDEGIIAESWKSHTLWLFGGGHLAKHGKSDDARIIHMPDASDIRSEIFAEFADLEEVSFGNPRVRVGNRAFAQCHRLRTVSFPNGGPSEGWAADNAFFDTPYDAEREHPYGPHRLRAIMYYRKFEIADPLEQELLAVGEPQEGVPALVEALSEQGLHIADEDALSLVKAILERLRDEDGNSLLVKGFDVQTREDGSRWLRQYRFESLGVSLEMVNEDDWEITREKIGPVWRSARSSSDVPDITIPNTVSEIGQTSFAYCRGIRRVVIPEGVREIGLMAFRSCKDLEEVVLPASLTKIEAGAFAGCVNLRSIRPPEGLETVASLAFCGCDALERIVLPNTVSELGYGVFAHCLALTEVHVPAGLAIPVEKHVFYGCTRLGSVRPQLRLGNLQTNDHEVLYELETAVWLYATFYLNDVNLVHNFVIQDIDEPDPSLIGSEICDAGLEEDIRYYFNHSNWIVFDDRVDIKVLREREGTEFMQTIVVETFRSLGVEVFSDTEKGLDYYEEKSSCVELISLRFLLFGDEWYVMTFEWSD